MLGLWAASFAPAPALQVRQFGFEHLQKSSFAFFLELVFQGELMRHFSQSVFVAFVDDEPLDLLAQIHIQDQVRNPSNFVPQTAVPCFGLLASTQVVSLQLMLFPALVHAKYGFVDLLGWPTQSSGWFGLVGLGEECAFFVELFNFACLQRLLLTHFVLVHAVQLVRLVQAEIALREDRTHGGHEVGLEGALEHFLFLQLLLPQPSLMLLGHLVQDQ